MQIQMLLHYFQENPFARRQIIQEDTDTDDVSIMVMQVPEEQKLQNI